MNNYYVYIYWRLDINEPFYVGMGHNNRWRDLYENRRNEHFIRIINKYPIAVEIIKDNLTEEQAHDIECWLINELVFEYGYSIDIKNNYSNEKGCHLVNCTWGGEGVSGFNMRKNKTREELTEINNKISRTKKEKGNSKGENNPFYGIRRCGKDNPSARAVICLTTNEIFECTKDAQRKYNIRDTSIRSCCNNITKTSGGMIWMYYDEYLESNEEKIKEKINRGNKKSFKGKESLNKKSVICLTTKKIFYTIVDASKYYNFSKSLIGKSIKDNKSCGKSIGLNLVFKYLIWNHNKKYRIKRTN